MDSGLVNQFTYSRMRHLLSQIRPLLVAAVCVIGVVGGPTTDPQTNAVAAPNRTVDAEKIRAARAVALKRLRTGLQAVAKYCDEHSLDTEGNEVRTLLSAAGSDVVRAAVLPNQVQPPIPAALSTEQRFVATQLQRHQRDYAETSFRLAKQAVASGHVNLAFDLVRETLAHNPDHAAARRVSGQVKFGTDWVSPFEQEMRKRKFEWTDDFGWMSKTQTDRYRNGERNYDGRWISAEKEAEIRRDFRNAWQVRTSHYLIHTNHSQKRGVELATKLEDLRNLVTQLLAAFFVNKAQADAAFAGTSARQIPKPHVVYFFRTREEYLKELRGRTDQPIEITQGMYFPTNGLALFFDNPESTDDSTVFHEGTHQLLSGARPGIGPIGVLANFWVIEGIASYMESFRRDETGTNVGNPNHPRILAARHNIRTGTYFIPLRELAGLGISQFQRHPSIAMNYSQSAGYVHFFLHYQDGLYREEFVEHLSQIYRKDAIGRNAPKSMEDLTGVSFEELDAQYREYMLHLGEERPVNVANDTDDAVDPPLPEFQFGENSGTSEIGDTGNKGAADDGPGSNSDKSPDQDSPSDDAAESDATTDTAPSSARRD